MTRFVCIHGHFYQPPRENPWLDVVELQDSAYPYHDWNERVTAECYSPNASSRILDDQKRIVKIVNNYARISFNFGSSLMTWMEEKANETYRAVLAADRESAERFSGHGSALAQACNHSILPLANRRDKVTEVMWGIRDFRHRFGREPEGMWLPETAVDIETLEVLAECGIRFTILEPQQARHVREFGASHWQDVGGGQLDPTMPYECFLPSGRKIAIFFYDGPVSRAVAFERLLTKGEYLAHRLTGLFSDKRNHPQLVHIATDGETYGHHHSNGDMALAYALDYIDSNHLGQLTNYGEFLEKHPSTHEVEIHTNTSWSCVHGVERWRADCGCHTGGEPGWNQQWRAPLRTALEWLRDLLIPLYEEFAGELLRDPWAARNDYFDVVLDRSDDRIEEFFSTHAVRPLTPDEIVTALELLEMQRHAILMFTSCGWFFNEISGIETVQILHYAGRALQLAESVSGRTIEPEFLSRLEAAKSNIPEFGDGRQIYEQQVIPAKVDLARVGAHYAVASLFESYPTSSRVYCYDVTREDYSDFEAGRARVTTGLLRIQSRITKRTELLGFGLLYLGDVNVTGGIRKFDERGSFDRFNAELLDPVNQNDFASVIRVLDRHFERLTFSIKSLFRDEQRRILHIIWDSTLSEAEAAFGQLHDRYVPLMKFHADLAVPLPRVLQLAAEVDLNLHLRSAFEEDELPISRIEALLKEVKAAKVSLDESSLSFTLNGTIEKLAARFVADPFDPVTMERLEAAVNLVPKLPIEVELWKAQNGCYRVLQHVIESGRNQESSDELLSWFQRLRKLCEKLSVRVDPELFPILHRNESGVGTGRA